MAHRKNAEDIEELKKSLNFLSADMSTVMKQQAILMELFAEVKLLKIEAQEKDKKIHELEKRVQDIEQYTRMEDVIITGMNVKPRSYARAAAAGRADGEDAEPEDQQSLESQMIEFFAEKDIHIKADNIAACHTLPRKDGNEKPAIIVRFANRKHKTELLMQWKKLRGSEVYMNEHLTKKNGEIAREARRLRKQGKIKSTWTRNCKVMIRLKGATPEAEKVLTVREMKDLDTYK